MNPGFGRGFAGVRANRYPVRAAIEIGLGSTITATVARMDAPAGAIRDVLYHDSLAIPTKQRSEFPGVLDPACWPAITNTLRTMMGALAVHRATEYSALMTLNPTGSDNILSKWRQEMKMRVHCLHPAYAAMPLPRGERRLTFTSSSPFAAAGTLPPGELLDLLAFRSAAAAAQCVAPHTMLLLRETTEGVEIVGQDEPEALPASDDGGGEATTSPPLQAVGALKKHTFPMNTLNAHLELVQLVQRRLNATAASSPNPCTAEEFRTLTASMERRLAEQVPDWVLSRLECDSPIVCHGPNGGLWNIAARAAGRAHFGLETLELTGQHKLCGLTDVLLAESYPEPRYVVPQVALAAALMRCLATLRMQYLPDVGITHAMLVDDAFWLYTREAEIRQSIPADAQAQRHYEPPRAKFDPTRAREQLGSFAAHEPGFDTDERQWKPQFDTGKPFARR